MSSKNSNHDHSGLLAVCGLIVVALAGTTFFSGVILFVAVACAFTVIKSLRLGWLYSSWIMLCWGMGFYTLYQYSPFYELPLDALRWKTRLIWLIANFFEMDTDASYWRPLIRYLYLSLDFMPLGFIVWGALAVRHRWHQAIWKWWRTESVAWRSRTNYREKSADPFLGVDKNSGTPVFLSEDMRRRHTQVLGSTGYGKTESVLMNLIQNDIENGRGLLLIDGKGDTAFRDQILCHAMHHERHDDICLLDYSDAAASMTYNPLLHGSAAEVRDRIIASLDWSEEYYKKCASSALLLALKVLEHQGRAPTLELLKDFLLTPKGFDKSIPDGFQPLFHDFCDNHAKRLPEVRGLVTDLCNIIQSGAGTLLSRSEPEIDLLQCVLGKKIVIFQVSTLDYGLSARTFGRLVIQDLKAVCGNILRRPSVKRDLFSVYIDEFESFAHESFNELLSKARGAGIGLTISHQSMGDLEKVGPYFKQQITENTNNKIILRVNDEETVSYFAGMAGTRQASRMTYQMQEDFLLARKTGIASRRDVEEFLVHPNVYRNLGIGEAVVMTRNDSQARLVGLSRPDRFQVPYDFTEALRTYRRRADGEKASHSAAKPHQTGLSAEIF